MAYFLEDFSGVDDNEDFREGKLFSMFSSSSSEDPDDDDDDDY